MARSATTTVQPLARPSEALLQVIIVIAASFFVALCARVELPLPFTPVPLTLASFGVLLVGLVLGPARAGAALLLYLAEGAAGLPVFAASGAPGFARFFGPTAGYLFAYPVCAVIAGALSRHPLGNLRPLGFGANVIAAFVAHTVLLLSGSLWLFSLTGSFALAASLGFVPFIFGEVIKVMTASAVAARWHRVRSR